MSTAKPDPTDLSQPEELPYVPSIATNSSLPPARCKTCKHWATEHLFRRSCHERIMRPEDPDTFLPMVMPFEVRLCQNPKLLFCERPIEQDGFAVADGSEYMANLITAENFGCIHHEK